MARKQAIDLISQVLLKKGDTVAVEDPGFPGARLSFMYREMNIYPAPVDEEGIMVNTVPRQTKLIAVTPSHQRPTRCMYECQQKAGTAEICCQPSVLYTRG
nr:hypothetical protein [Bacillus pumilus]